MCRVIGCKNKNAYPKFNLDGFVNYIDDHLEDQSFSFRQELFADAFDKYMTDSYETNIEIFTKILGPELQQSEGMFTEGWWLWPVGRYVERHGCENRAESFQLIYELTKRFTGEFAIRPLLIEDPKATLEILLQWSRDDNVHVRRLASEGMRISLPWAKKTVAALEEVELFKTVLDNLKNDSEKFVMKSVGNNINDLMKVRPELAEEIIKAWQIEDMSLTTEWIIRHGLRSKQKKK